MILVFGILGWIITCPVFSVMAWMMGTSDLREMRTGRMDSSGMGLTQAGQILGMIYTLLWLIVVVIGIFFMMLAMGAQAF
jgi:K+ transporter